MPRALLPKNHLNRTGTPKRGVMGCLILLVIGTAVSATPTLSPERAAKLDAYAQNTPNQVSTDIQSLSAYLMKPARTETEKARLIFSWMAYHVAYDARGFNTGKPGDNSASGVLKSRKGVCEGMSNLFEALCVASGLEAVTIAGYSKGYGYQPNQKFHESDHTWNAVKADGRWMLVDVTWGEGYGEAKYGKMLARKKFNPYWFDTDPLEFIFTHLPENPQWQLIPDPITLQAYEKLPWVHPLLFYYGLPPEPIFTAIRENPSVQFVTVYLVDSPLGIELAPVEKTLPKNQPVTFILLSPDAVDVAAINNKNWIPFRREEKERYTLTLTPDAGELLIGARFSEKTKEYQMILEYRVGK